MSNPERGVEFPHWNVKPPLRGRRPYLRMFSELGRGTEGSLLQSRRRCISWQISEV
jgi:hypothetical protein